MSTVPNSDSATQERCATSGATYNNMAEGLEAAEAVRRRGDQAGALRIFSELRERYPDHPAPYLRAAGMLSQSGRFQEAQALLVQGADRYHRDRLAVRS